MVVVTVRYIPAFNNGFSATRHLFEKLADSDIVIDRVGVSAVNNKESALRGFNYVTHSAVNQRMVNFKLPESCVFAV